MAKTSKISVSLPGDVVADLDYLATRLGVSRSALISEFMGEAVSDMRRILEVIPPNPTPADLLRMRGQSEELVRQRVESLKGMSDDLFTRK